MTGVQTCALPICFPVTISKVGIFGEMKLRAVSLFKMAHNVSGLGVVAEIGKQKYKNGTEGK